jgi:hypothetical protein
MCGQTVTKKKATFYPPYQGPSPGETLFRGWIVNTTTGQIIPNNTYALQWIVQGTGNQGCASAVPNSTSDFSFAAANPNQYGMVAHFKPNMVPNTNHTSSMVFGRYPEIKRTRN